MRLPEHDFITFAHIHHTYEHCWCLLQQVVHDRGVADIVLRLTSKVVQYHVTKLLAFQLYWYNTSRVSLHSSHVPELSQYGDEQATDPLLNTHC